MRSLALLAALSILAACADASKPGEVRSAIRAVEVAQATLREAGFDELVLTSDKRGENWVVVTRSSKTPNFGHVVTVEAATGKVSVDKYQSVQLGR
jgi:hypothetical protein